MVLAYNPTTGQTDTEPIQHVWINHDHDLVDVGLVGSVGVQATNTPTSPSGNRPAATSEVSRPTTAPSGLSRTLRAVTAAVAIALAMTLGSAAPDSTPLSGSATTTAAHIAPTETIHTTANHPWLTDDRGWVEAVAGHEKSLRVAGLPRKARVGWHVGVFDADTPAGTERRAG